MSIDNGIPSPEIKPLNDQELVYLARLMVAMNPDNVEHFKKIRPDDWAVIKHLVIDEAAKAADQPMSGYHALLAGLKHLRDTTPMVMQRKYIDSVLDAAGVKHVD